MGESVLASNVVCVDTPFMTASCDANCDNRLLSHDPLVMMVGFRTLVNLFHTTCICVVSAGNAMAAVTARLPPLSPLQRLHGWTV